MPPRSVCGDFYTIPEFLRLAGFSDKNPYALWKSKERPA
jgi:hypothetical protein